MLSRITGHMIVKNEDRFIWYSIKSVIPFVDKLIIFDTGSTDQTVNIIKTFKDKKIIFEEKKISADKTLAALRQEQIDRTRTPWIWIIDGDEVYPKETVQEILKTVNGGKEYLGIIVHRYDLIGDIYHFQCEKVGAYNQFGKIGHYVLRLINKEKFPGLCVLGEYPNEYFADKKGYPIKSYGQDAFAFVEKRIFHAMYLKRSSRGANLFEVINRNKWKIELGEKIDKNKLPEVFFKSKPDFVPEVTKPINFSYKIMACFLTPLKKIKRKFL